MPFRPEQLTDAQRAVVDNAAEHVHEADIQLAQLILELPDQQKSFSFYDFALGQNIADRVGPDSVSGMVAEKVSSQLIEMLSAADGGIDSELRGIIAFTAALAARAIDAVGDEVEQVELPS